MATNYRLHRQNREVLTRHLLARHEYARSYRTAWEDRAVDWYKLYVGYRERRDDGRSNLHIPRPYELLDSLRARIVKSFFASRPYFEFIPRPSGVEGMQPWVRQANDRKAQIAGALVDDQLEKNGIYSLFYNWVTELLISPLAVMSVGWRYETRMVRRRVEQPVIVINPWTGHPVPAFDPFTGRPLTQLVTVESEEAVWDDNHLQLVDFWDFWPDPQGHDVDSCRYVYQREWMTRQQIEDRLAVLDSEMVSVGAGRLYPVRWDDIDGQSDSLRAEGKWQRLSAVGVTIDSAGGDHWEPGEQPGQVYEVLHYWTDDDYAMIINRAELAYVGANPFWRHGKKPYVFASYDPLPHETYGMSAIQIIEHLAHEHNTLRNQRIDNVALALNRMWKKRKHADIDDSELVSRPHGIINVDDMGDVEPLVTPDVTASAYTEEAIVKADQENSLGVAPVVRGVTGSGQQTATEIMNQTTSAAIRFDVKIKLYEVLGLSRLVYLMDCNNQQFMDGTRLVRFYTDENVWEWIAVQPGELVGEYDYRPAGAAVDPAANREVRRQQLFQMIEAAARLRLPHLKLDALVREWVNTFDFRNPDKFLMSDQEIQQLMLMQQLAAAGATPGGGASTALPSPTPALPVGPQMSGAGLPPIMTAISGGASAEV